MQCLQRITIDCLQELRARELFLKTKRKACLIPMRADSRRKHLGRRCHEVGRVSKDAPSCNVLRLRQNTKKGSINHGWNRAKQDRVLRQPHDQHISYCVSPANSIRSTWHLFFQKGQTPTHVTSPHTHSPEQRKIVRMTRH